VDTGYIRGLTKTKNGVTILLDLDRMLNDPKASPQS
jgi:chemotaxis signal transduction protein